MSKAVCAAATFALFLISGWAPAPAAAVPRAADDEPATTCGYASSETLYTQRTEGLEQVRRAINAAMDQWQRAGLSTDMPVGANFRIPKDVENLTISVDRFSCGMNAVPSRANTPTFDCNSVGCVEPFPGNNAPIGSTMTLSSCQGNVRTTVVYERTDLGWVVIRYNEERVKSCTSSGA